MKRFLASGILMIVALGPAVAGQGGRMPSPPGTAATEIGGKYLSEADPVYLGGKWIEITYSRPIKRGRDLWGTGANYGKMLNSGAPVWRAGANVSTRLKTEVPLVIARQAVPRGEYSLFIDLQPKNWTFIVSSWAAQTDFDPNNRAALWGSFGYTPEKDIVRAPMTLGTIPFSFDQVTWAFLDMSDAGGKMALMWDKVVASVPFTVAK